MTCLREVKVYSAAMSESPFINRRQRARNRNYIPIRAIIMGILVMGAIWAGFWFWLGQDSEAAYYLLEWFTAAIMIVTILFGAAFITVALRKLLAKFKKSDNSFAALAEEERAADSRDQPPQN